MGYIRLNLWVAYMYGMLVKSPLYLSNSKALGDKHITTKLVVEI